MATTPSGTVRGIARVVPATTSNVSGWGSSHTNILSADARTSTNTWLVAQSAEDGQPVEPKATELDVDLPNWLRVVMYDAGSTQGQAEHLPPHLDVPVFIDPTTRKVVGLDVDATDALLREYRDIGIREWKATETPLAGVRQAARLSGAAAREVPGMFRGIRKAFRSLREDMAQDDGPHPLEQGAGEGVRGHLAANPQQHAMVRSSVLSSAPTMAREVAAGRHPAPDFEAWLAFQESSGILTAAEVDGLRRTAGIA